MRIRPRTCDAFALAGPFAAVGAAGRDTGLIGVVMMAAAQWRIGGPCVAPLRVDVLLEIGPAATVESRGETRERHQGSPCSCQEQNKNIGCAKTTGGANFPVVNCGE
jgi:hypothetical protein